MDELEDNVASSEHAFFIEKDEVMRLLKELASEDFVEADLTRNVEHLEKILEKYQEQCTLLDPHLEAMMEILTTRARDIMLAVYETQRAAMDGDFPFQCERSPQQHALFCVVYNLCRCRGYKTVVKFFPHEVRDLEPLMCMLQSQDRMDHTSWESRYALLLWLSMLVLIPFDIYTIDSSIDTGAVSGKGSAYYGQAQLDGGESSGKGDSGGGGSQTLVGAILALCREYMCDSGPTRDAAAVCLSSLLTRPDMDEFYFLEFVAWAGALLSEDNLLGNTSNNTFLVTGVLMTLTQIFKKGHRSHLLGVIEHLFPHILHLARQKSSSTLLRKLNVKLFQRIGMAFMPPRVVSWAYQRGQRSLLQNLSASSQERKKENEKARNGAKMTEDNSDVWVPDELEDVVEQLLVGLRDRDTIVRWSAAKGVGRITSLLPKDLADDVVASVFELFSNGEGDGAWHGGCLALAELARRGLLLPFRLPEAVPIVAKAIQYDVRRGSHSVGAHVRDAACYVCWAFARAYSPAVMRPHVDQLSEGMLLAALFDREINCRRAASAAFQENVGRQGHENFPHGIEILTTADYFTLGVRANAYLNISIFVAEFPKYRRALMTHVYEVKLFHWDTEIRALSSKTLGNMTRLDPVLVALTAIPSLLPYTTSPDLLKRHGSILGIAEAVAALTSLSYQMSDESVASIIAVVPQIEKARLYRGRGGEMVRQAACRLIESIAVAALPLPVKMQVRLLDSIDESIKHSMEPVQVQAVAALRSFTRTYFPVTGAGPTPRLQARIVDKYTDIMRNAEIASSTRGYALALGALPSKLMVFNPAVLDTVIDTLTMATRPDFKVGDEPDAETRRNAINALVELCETVGVSGAVESGLPPSRVHSVFETLMLAMTDYSMDKRGDVGSWSRIAAMEGLEKIALLSMPATAHGETLQSPVPGSTCSTVSSGATVGAGASPELCSRDMAERMLCALLKQLCEKLDNVRSKAGTILERLVQLQALRSLAPSAESLARVLQPSEGQASNNWSIAAETFPKMMCCLDLAPCFHDAVIAGLVLSVGGLTEAVVKSSSTALLNWARAKKAALAWPDLHRFGTVLMVLFDSHSGEDRVILPLMKTLEVLLESEVLDFLDDPAFSTPASTAPSSATGAAGATTSSSTFGADLMFRVKRELQRSTNIAKLFTGLNIALGLLQFSGQVRQGAMALVLELLGHRYPRVRKHSAEQFYSKLLVDERLVKPEVYDLVLEQLAATVWDAELQPVRAKRDTIAAAVKVHISRPAEDTAQAQRLAKKGDALDSYQHLIDDVGY